MEMFIRYLNVINFRGLSDFKAYMHKNLMCIVGRNDVGKSSVLRALCVILEKEKVGVEDFQKGSEDAPIEIEVHFECTGTDQLKHDGLIKLKQVHTKLDQRVLSKKMIFTQIEFPEIDKLDNYNTLKSVAKKLKIDVPSSKPNEAEILSLRQKVVQIIESSPAEGWVDFDWEEIKNNLPEIILIPASQDHESEQKMSSDSSLFGRLFRVGIRNWLKSDPESKSAMDTINSKVETINNHFLKIVEGKLKEQLPIAESLSQEVEPLDVSKGFSFTMHVKDEHGIKTALNQRGSGLQRAVLVAILRAQNDVNEMIAKMRTLEPAAADTTTSLASPPRQEHVKPTLYIFEEPESFLHLSAQKDLFYSLKDLSAQNSQVIITTHSTLFIDESELNDVVLLIRENGKTSSRQHIPADEVKDQLGERVKLSELLIGKVCCLVEGLSDKYAFEKWALRLGHDIKREGIHFISMDGCQNMDYFANVSILHDFNVPFKIILDRDSHGETNSEERIRFIKGRIPKLKHDCFVLLEKGELENYFCVDTVATTLNIPRDYIRDEDYRRDPKEQLKRATQRAMEAGSTNAKSYKATVHSKIIADSMPITALDDEIVKIIKDLSDQAETNAKAVEEIEQGLAEVATGESPAKNR